MDDAAFGVAVLAIGPHESRVDDHLAVVQFAIPTQQPQQIHANAMAQTGPALTRPTDCERSRLNSKILAGHPPNGSPSRAQFTAPSRSQDFPQAADYNDLLTRPRAEGICKN